MTVKDFFLYIENGLKNIYHKTETESMAYIILEEIAQLSRTDIYLNFNKTLPKETEVKCKSIVNQLKTKKPLQYILGFTEFYSLRFQLDKNVLIPRQETEELVDWIIKDNKESGLKLLDIGTGSGCIAISLAKNLSNSKITAFDFSPKALDKAKENAEFNQVKADFILWDILDKEKAFSQDEKFDIIVSNPPYVRELEKQKMQTNVLDFEPHSALFVSNENPLVFYNAIAEFAQKYLKENGKLYFEINEYLGKETVEMLKGLSFKNTELRQDINGRDRMIKAYKK